MKKILLFAAAGCLIGNLSAAQGDDAKNTELKERMGHMAKEHPELFAKLDANGDGKISKEEIETGMAVRDEQFKAKNPELFAKLDANGDGKLDKNERDAGREAFEEKLAEKNPKAFEHADKNGDGELDRREMHRAKDKAQERREGQGDGERPVVGDGKGERGQGERNKGGVKGGGHAK